MLETGIPKSLWRGEKMREKLVGQFDKEKDKFMNKPDTKFQPSIDQRLPETKKFAYANQVSDFGLNDMISDKKFRFENVNNSILLGEQLPDDRPFKISLGIKGINDHFDSMAPNKDYRYTDPQFYEYKLKDMTQQKIAETNWRVQGDTTTNPDDLDSYARAIAYAQEYKRSKEAKSSPPSPVQSSSPSPVQGDSSLSAAAGGGGGSARKVNTNLKNALEEARNAKSGSNSSRRNSGEIPTEVKETMDDIVGKIQIQQAKRASKMADKNYLPFKEYGLNKLGNLKTKLDSTENKQKKAFLHWKEHSNENGKGKESLKNTVNTESAPVQKETAKETSVPTIQPGNYADLQKNLDIFFKDFEKDFKYIQDPENKSEMTISNGTEKVGSDIAKFMREKLNITIRADSTKYKANEEINNLESALNTMKQSPRMGRTRGVKAKSKTTDDLHFESRTPASSKKADATRTEKTVSQGADARRVIKKGIGSRFGEV